MYTRSEMRIAISQMSASNTFFLAQKLLLELKCEWRCKIAMSGVFLFAFVFTIGAHRMDHPTRNVCLQNNTRNRRRDTINILFSVPAQNRYRMATCACARTKNVSQLTAREELARSTWFFFEAGNRSLLLADALDGTRREKRPLYLQNK
jgi:hypothetical protein